MTIALEIMKFLSRSLDFTSSTASIQDKIESIGYRPGSARSSLSSLVKGGALERIERGIYKIKELYREFRHTKRIKETHTKNPVRSYDLDVEATSEGLVPSWLSIRKIENILNPELIDETLTLLSEHGFFIAVEKVEFEIMGSEWLERIEGKFDPFHQVEVIVINNTGTRYLYHGGFNVRIKDFDD